MSHTAPEFLKRHQIVRAGAGAGKTYTLTHKVMDIADEVFKREKRWPRIVVTTFTRKATQELRERLMLLALEEKPHLVEFINSRSNLMVSTIHGVMDLFLKRYGSQLDLDPGYTVISGSQATKIARQVLRHVLLSEGGEADLLETIPFNRLTGLVRQLDQTYGEDPDVTPFTAQDFANLFAAKALRVARELESAAFNIREETTKEPWLKMADDYLKFAEILKRPDWASARAALESAIVGMGRAPQFRKESPPVTEMTNEDAKAAREHAKDLLEPENDPAAWLELSGQFATLERVARAFSREFRAAKRRRGSLEIGDLELLVMEAVRKSPEAAAAFASEWDHWLIDEYQDTSPFQVRLLRELTGHDPVFVVGDPQQSIYLFRGARAEVFAQRENEIVGGGGERKLLTVNRRSNPELLLFLNDFFGRFNPPFQAMEPFFEGDREIDPSKIVAEFFVAPEPEEPTEKADAVDERSVEMKAIVARVQNLMAAGARPDDICVIARKKQTLYDVADWLVQYGISTHVHASAEFFERREIRDALALLKFLINPHDTFNAVEVMRSPSFRLSDALMVDVIQAAAGSASRAARPSLWQSLTAPGAGFVKTEADRHSLERLQADLQNVTAMGLTGAFRNALVSSGFIDLSHVHDTSGRRESNIWKLLARLESEEARPGFNPLAFVAGTVAELKLEDGNGEGDAVTALEPNRVNLMTVHGSKGLEFQHVIVPQCDLKPKLTDWTDFFYEPSLHKWGIRGTLSEDDQTASSLAEQEYIGHFKTQELDENVRVLYVALTRAVESVFLTWTGQPKKNSWAELIKLDLARGVHHEASYTYLVSDTPVEPSPRASSKSEDVSVRAKWREIADQPAAPTALSVTEILERKAAPAQVATDRDVVQRMKVATIGTAVHKLMELLKYPSQEQIGGLVARWFPKQKAKVLKAIEFVRNAKSPPLLKIIENGEVEWGFAMMHQGVLIEGAVDLWGRAPDGTVWIVDYKTGNPLKRALAFEQMSLYSLALRQSGLLAPTDRIQMAAVYPFGEEIFIADEPTAAQMKARFEL